MKRRPSYSPIHNLQTFDMLEVSAVVGDYSQVFDFSCAAYKKVEICLPSKALLFLGQKYGWFLRK